MCHLATLFIIPLRLNEELKIKSLSDVQKLDPVAIYSVLNAEDGVQWRQAIKDQGVSSSAWNWSKYNFP